MIEGLQPILCSYLEWCACKHECVRACVYLVVPQRYGEVGQNLQNQG